MWTIYKKPRRTRNWPIFSHNNYLLLSLATFLLLSSDSFISQVSSFNVDWYYPIIIKTVEGFGGTSSPNQFGASVTLLKPEQGDHSWIVIGAPKANSTQHSDIPEPGAILQCSLGKNPADICRPVVMDPAGNYFAGEVTEWKNNSLLGGPNGIAISSKSFVACASRLERWVDGKGKSTIGYMHGSCYVRPKSHLIQQQPPSNDFQRLNPLQEGKYEGKRTDRNGQAGFAVHFSKSGTELVMTAPGLERWMGSVIQYESRDGGEKFTKSYVSPASSCPASGLGCFNYFGYSITSGYYYQRDVNVVNNAAPVYYAAGVPRANNLVGKVVIFRFPNSPDKPLEIQQEVAGTQPGGYFGGSLLSVDLNGDGYDDLIVGSPRFSRDQNVKLRGRGPMMLAAELLLDSRAFDRFGGYGDEGAVFIHYSRNGGRGLLEQHPRHLKGGNRPWSHFGTAMASLGDLNRDGYTDFAVSAPFEDTTGVVYIYFGNKEGNIISHSQIILGKRIDTGLRGFGFSLTGNEDIDNNGFNDIAIGSFNSSQVVVLRSKPIVTVYGVVKSSLSKLPLTTDTFKIESCVSIAGDYIPSTVQLNVILRADSDFMPERVKIVQEKDFGKPPSSMIEYTQTVRKSDGEICTKFHAIVTEALESAGVPVMFRQIISIPQEQTIVKSRRMNIPRNSEDMYTDGAKFSDFCKTCPLINTGKPTTFMLQLPLAVPCGDDDRCQSDLFLQIDFKDADLSSGRFLVGSSPSISMMIQLGNRNETAMQPSVLVAWNEELKLKKIPADCFQTDFTLSPEITYKCSFGKLLEKGQTQNVSLEFDMTSLVATESGRMHTELFWNVTALTVSEMASPVSQSVILPLSYQADPYIEASRRFEVFNMDTLAKYVVFTHVFEVSMEGPSPVRDLIAVFQLPVNLTTENEGTLVNVRGVKINEGEKGTGLACRTIKGHFSKSDDALSSDDLDVDSEDPDFDAAGIGGLLPKEKDVSRGSNSSFIENERLMLHCGSPFVACMEVECKTTSVFHPGTTEVVTFVIDIASDDIRKLMKDHKVSSIQVESQGTLILSSVIKDIQPKPNKPDEATAITLIEKEGYKPVSKWIYILAVVIGILIFLCVGFCLYACGCFEEKHPKRGENGDVVDGGDGASAEEMEELMTKQNQDNADQKTNDDEQQENDDNDGHEQRNGSIATSPFSDVTDPPEFVPTEPTIPEESENDYESVK